MTAAVAAFEDRAEPGALASALLAAGVHLLLLLVLVFGVRWQNRPPESVEVELWEPPTQVQEEPKPAPRAEPPPPPVVKAEPVPPKADIVEKKAPPPKPAPKREPPKVKAEPAKAPPRPNDEAAQRQIREQLMREQAALAIEQERRQMREQLALEASTIHNRALADWKAKIGLYIKNRINKQIADSVPGNPEAVFMVTLLPTCEVLKVSKIKSSGIQAYDDEVERAILRSSPLPKPDKSDVFDRELRLSFRPKEL